MRSSAKLSGHIGERIVPLAIMRVAPVALACLLAGPAAAQQMPLASPPPVPETASDPQGMLREPILIQRAVLFGDRNLAGGEGNNGFHYEIGKMIPGAGWISVGPGYRRWSAHDSVFVSASAAMSLRGYKTAQARFELPRIAGSRLAVGSQIMWQDVTQVTFYGENPNALQRNRSEYRLRSTNLVGYATFRPARGVDIGAKVGWLTPSVLPRGGLFKRDFPDTRDVFAGNIVFALSDQPSFVHSEASITADTRDFPDHPSQGGVYRVAAANYSGRSTSLLNFRRYEAEAARFVPLADSQFVVALHGWLIGSDTSKGQFVPFYLQPSLGGQNTLRGYADYRFHDRNLLVVNAEVRAAMMRHVDAAVFVDAGDVAARFGDLNLGKRSYGAGLRLHSRQQTFARLDVARGGEGWGFLFRLTDPLNLARLSRRTANVPFVP